MFPMALSTDEQAMVDSGTSALTNLGLASAGVAVGGLVYLGLRSIYASVATAIRTRGSRI